MMKKLLLTTRGALSFWSNSEHSLTRLSLYRSPKWESIEINKYVGQSNIQWRGCSFAASVPSDKSNTLKTQKRVSREERRARVESFVKKYREMNAGKFPTISDTRKQVGGSYYVVREIVQELEYKSKTDSLNIMDKNLAGNELVNESKHFTETVRVSSGKTGTTIDGHVQNDLHLVDLDYNEIVNAVYEEKGEPQTSMSLSDEAVTTIVKSEEAGSSYSKSIALESHPLTQDMEQVSLPFSEKSGSNNDQAQRHDPQFVDMEKDAEETSQSGLQISNEIKARCHPLTEELENIPAPFSDKSGGSHGKAQSHDHEYVDVENHPETDKKFIEKAENERRGQAALEGLPGVDNPEHKMEHSQRSSILDENKRDNSNNEAGDSVVSNNSTLWGNLKSFADGVMKFWRKL